MFSRPLTAITASLLAACLLGGCGGSPETKEPSPRKTQPRRTEQAPSLDSQKTARPARPAPTLPTRGSQPSVAASTAAAASGPRKASRSGAAREPGAERTAASRPPSEPARDAQPTPPRRPRPKLDDARLAAAGIRKISGKRLVLYTDLPRDDEIDVLPEVLAQAFPQWCKYFDIDPSKHPDWSLIGYLMNDKALFRRSGLLPDALPPFPNGFSWNHEFWLYEQPSAYYRRHLVLHEGTHCFMDTLLGGCGPPWYKEGTAEIFGTHRWAEGRLAMNYFPANKEEVLQWGRIRTLNDAYAAGRAMPLDSVIDYGWSAHHANEPYAWCWAAAAWLDRHPRYGDCFRQLHKHVLKPDLSTRFRQMVGDEWDRLADEWQVFIAELEYGHDIAKTTVDLTPGRPLPAAGASLNVSAELGWQNSGLRLQQGVACRLRGAGRYQVAKQPQIWWCEPGGVSIRYYRGRPLGILLAAIRPEEPSGQPSELLRPTVVGLECVLRPKQTGTLFLKINDSPAELNDNAGELSLRIEPE